MSSATPSIPSRRLTGDQRRQRLLDAAFRLFSRRGYQGTTTRQIAHAAGVTEAIVFRHFPRKEDLYWAVISAQCISPEERGRNLQALELELNGSDEEVFSAIAADILRRNTKNPDLSRLLLFSALENHELSHRFFRTYISEYYEVVAQRIRERISGGRFRDVDPLLAARSFIGMFFYHFLIQELFGGKKIKDFDPAEVSRTLTQVWLQGMVTSQSIAAQNGIAKNGKHLA